LGENAAVCVRRVKSLRAGSGEGGPASCDVCRDSGALEDMPSRCAAEHEGCHGVVKGRTTSRPKVYWGENLETANLETPHESLIGDQSVG